MTITINGTGTVTGITAGGLPDAVITTAEIADANITAAKLSGAQNGSAPIYAARAWVNFNGTGTVAIRASGNVSSITDNGTGDYTVNFTTAMPDANYSAQFNGGFNFVGSYGRFVEIYGVPTVSAVRCLANINSAVTDLPIITCSVFR